MTSLIVAAGGGGDAITGSALAGPLGVREIPAVMTYAWDRLMIDPLPGPRAASDFTGLDELAPGVLEVLPTTKPIAPAGSSLPRLAEDLPTRLILMDPSAGAVGMAQQIRATAEFFGARDVVLVDVGGDILTDGTDPGLRSPLADQLSLAAAIRSGLPVRVVIAAAGIDGELDAAVIFQWLQRLNAERLPDLTMAETRLIHHVFEWHPSEASGLLTAAAAGHRGLVEVRDAGDQVELSDLTPMLFLVDGHDLIDLTPAGHLCESPSLDQAEQIVRDKTGISEIRYETEKAAGRDRALTHSPTAEDVKLIDRLAGEAVNRGADYVSVRRLAEQLGATTIQTFADLTALLAELRPTRYQRSIYRV